MKITILAALLAISSSAFADFSSELILGDGQNQQELKDFKGSNIQNIHRKSKEIVLTFDDGPTPGATDKILDVLKAKNIKATFFIIASKVSAAPDLMKRIVDEGHIVANHSLTHKNMAEQSIFKWKKAARSEIMGAHEILKPYTKNYKTFFYRAPHGAWESKIANLLNEEYSVSRDYRGPIMWDIGGSVRKENGIYVEAADWACWAQKMTVNECLEGYVNDTRKKGGGVVLMHDLRSLSAELTGKLIDTLENEGYTFKNLDEINL